MEPGYLRNCLIQWDWPSLPAQAEGAPCGPISQRIPAGRGHKSQFFLLWLLSSETLCPPPQGEICTHLSGFLKEAEESDSANWLRALMRVPHSGDG